MTAALRHGVAAHRSYEYDRAKPANHAGHSDRSSGCPDHSSEAHTRPSRESFCLQCIPQYNCLAYFHLLLYLFSVSLELLQSIPRQFLLEIMFYDWV